MKAYPSIPRSTGMTFQEIPNAYVFDKEDGSNLRFEWSRKRKQWMKFTANARASEARVDPVKAVQTKKSLAAYQEKLSAVRDHTTMAQEYARQALVAAKKRSALTV